MTGRGGNAARVVVLVAAGALVTGSTPGCSMGFVKRAPPTEERGAVVRCTSSDILPLVDMMVAVIQVIRFSIAYSANEGAYKGMTLSRDSDMMIGAGMAGLFALSAGGGGVASPAGRDVWPCRRAWGSRRRANAVRPGRRCTPPIRRGLDGGRRPRPSCETRRPPRQRDKTRPPPPTRAS